MSTYHILGLKKRRAAKLVWKNCCTTGNPSLYKFLNEVFEQNFDRVLLINRTRREVKIRNSKKIAVNWIKPIVDWVVKGLCGGDAKEHSGTSEGNNRSSNGPAAQPKEEIAEGTSSNSTKKKDGEKKEDPSSLLVHWVAILAASFKDPASMRNRDMIKRKYLLDLIRGGGKLKKERKISTRSGHFSRTIAKGPDTTTWIWNLHADAHDFDSQTSDLEEISRKVFSAHFGQLSIIFLWLSGMYFHGACFSNYEAWLSDPTHIGPSA
ncbi:hypothetical protein ACH5RR_023670 [Cinchona calisaya]|uniref:Uncharacterized protein n=1 Tax=Cinchona calisaya TaxID=153742 RepID=A0ABD2ZGD0_9GENT